MKMNRTCLALLIGIIIGINGNSQQSRPEPATPEEKAERLLEFWDRTDQPGGALFVIKDGQVIYQKCWGLASQELGVAIHSKTVFDTVSLAETATGLAVLKLMNDGILNPDEKISAVLNNLPESMKGITVRQLLEQTGGLGDWVTAVRLNGMAERGRIDRKATLELLKRIPLSSAPGAKYAYSPAHYMLLADIIKTTTGRNFAEWTWENLFRPLKMTRTLFRENCREVIENRAFSYHMPGTGYLRGADNLSICGSHNLFSTIEDMEKWLLNLETLEIGGKKWIDWILETESKRYAYGWYINNVRGIRQIHQGGKWGGLSCEFFYIPAVRFGAGFLFNWDYRNILASSFVSAVAESFLPQEALSAAVNPGKPAANEFRPNPLLLGKFTGAYQNYPGYQYVIEQKGEGIRLKIDEKNYDLIPIAEATFKLKSMDYQIVFEKDKAGEYSYLIWDMGGSTGIMPRVLSSELDSMSLEEYQGKFVNSVIQAEFSISLNGDKLLLTDSNGTKIQLQPLGKDRFYSMSDLFPYVIFLRDKENSINRFYIENETSREFEFIKE